MKGNIGEVLKGSDHSLNAMLSCHLLGGTGEKHTRLESRQLVSQQRLELGQWYSTFVVRVPPEVISL
jgi:hypothetical protein